MCGEFGNEKRQLHYEREVKMMLDNKSEQK